MWLGDHVKGGLVELRLRPVYLGKARDFKNHVTPAVFSFVVTSTYV